MYQSIKKIKTSYQIGLLEHKKLAIPDFYADKQRPLNSAPPTTALNQSAK